MNKFNFSNIEADSLESLENAVLDCLVERGYWLADNGSNDYIYTVSVVPILA